MERALRQKAHQPSDEHQHDADQHHEPGAALRLGALEAAARVPHQVTDAGDEVVAEGDEQRGVHELENRQRQHRVARA